MSINLHRFARAASLAALAGGLSTAAVAQTTYRVVAYTGGFAPGGGFYSTLERPRISAQGRVAFAGRVVGVLNTSRIWSEGVSGMNNLTLVARQGDPIPGAPNTTFGTLSPNSSAIRMNADGALSIWAPIAGNLAQFGDHGIVRHDAMGLDALAMPGQLVSLPCGGFGCQRWLTDIYAPSFNALGQVAFKAKIDGTGVNDGNDSLFLRTDGGAFSVIAREGDVPPNTIGVTYSEAWYFATQLNDNGEVALSSLLQGEDEAYWSVWRGAPGAMSLVVAEGWTAPTGNEFLDGLFGVGELAFNNSMHTAFHQIVPNDDGVNRTGLWVRRGGGVETICYEGVLAPNGIPYAWPGGTSASMNGAGDVAFSATLGAPASASNNDVIVRRAQNGAAQIIAREGSQAPGLPAGTLYGPISPMVSMTLDGRILYYTNLIGTGVNASNNQALWISRNDEQPAMLIREGQSIPVGGKLRTVEAFEVAPGTGWEAGDPPPVSHLGQVAMRVEFTDGTEAIIVATAGLSCPGDVDGNRRVDFSDLNALLGGFGHVGDVVVGDLDLDGDVDFADLNAVLANFGDQCPL